MLALLCAETLQNVQHARTVRCTVLQSTLALLSNQLSGNKHKTAAVL